MTAAKTSSASTATYTPPTTGADFSFPYATPYDIQLSLMRHLSSTLSNSQVSIIESPTGTGKSLSLISSSLTWLRHAKELEREEVRRKVRAEVEGKEEGEPDWVVEQEVERQLKRLEREELELEERLEEIRKKEREEKKRGAVGGGRKKMKFSHASSTAQNSLEDAFAPDPYDDEEDRNKVDDNAADNYTPAVREALRLLESNGGKKRIPKEEEEPDVQKVFYASRTHSQLSQFVSEVRKTSFAHSAPSTPTESQTPSASPATPRHPVRVIPLGSRQNLCINDEVKTKANGNNEVLGDMCAELQKGEKRCAFLPRREEGGGRMEEFRDAALANVHDIEDIEDLGRKMHVCPYYGSRRALKSAELVTLPYNMLMQKSAREALGISLKNHVVVVDEAHNLIQTLLDLHTVSITSSTLTSLRQALLTYFTKFKSRFKGSNAMYLKQLLVVLRGLSDFAEGWGKEGKVTEFKREQVFKANEVVGKMKGAMDQVNMLKLDQYLTESRIARKIGGYMEFLEEEKASVGTKTLKSNATRNLHRIQSFLVSLTNAQNDGRILLSSETVVLPGVGGNAGARRTEVTMKYLLLAPADAFKDVVEESKAVVLAGGTMSPMSDFQEQLFPYLPIERFSTFSCGHIVAPDRILTLAVGKGPAGTTFNFTFENRKNEKLMDDLGSAIYNICNVVAKGVVVFVPSKDFLAQIQTRWTTSGFLERLGKKKMTFWEPKERADVEPTLNEYAAVNSTSGTGGILFAVVDAKLSEGINFADDMARAVIIVGIPYPSRHSTEIQERMKYLTSLPRHPSLPAGKNAGQVLYQNMAFRGVNQSIGRAIRHQFDWASIILLDERYQKPTVQTQLPGWLGTDVKSPPTFGAVMKELSQFQMRLGKKSSAR